MAFTYRPLWRLLKERNIRKTHLVKLAGISSATLHQLRCGKNIGMSVLGRICEALDCRIEDIIEYTPIKEV